MRHFSTLLQLGIKRRGRDFFVLFYNIAFPAAIILLLGYLTSKSYGSDFSSYHYYTLVTIPFCALMGISTVSYAVQDEKMLHTSCRFMTAPITLTELVLSKFISCALVLSLCNAVTLLAAKLLLGLNLNGGYLLLVLLLTCETIMVTGTGLYLGLACKNLNALKNFLNLPIIIFGLLGGSFFPVGSYHPILSAMMKLSPLTWVNRGILSSIYDSNSGILLALSALFMFSGIGLTFLTIKFFKKEAFI